MSRMATPTRTSQKMTIDISKVKGTIKTFHACRVELGVAKREALMKKTMDGVSGAVGGLGVAVGGLMSGLIKNLPTKLTDKFDTWKFTKSADFVEACEILLEMMMQINEIFSPPVLSKPNLQYMLGQLQRQHISISFYGDSNVGKSTILNSIMGDRYLPVSRKSETAAAVHVVYENPAVPPSPSADTISASKEDELIEFRTHRLVAEGVENIRQALEKENKSLRSHEDQRGSMKEFLLKLKHPPAGADPTSNFDLIDNPGCDEFSTGAILTSIKIAEDYSAAFVVVTSLDTYRNDDFSNFLLKIYSKNKAILKQNRLTVVINKMDEALCETYEESSYTKDEVITTVYEYLCEKVFKCRHADFPKESCVLVCGLWALRCRQLKKYPEDKKLQKFIHRHINDLSDIDEFEEEMMASSYRELEIEDQAKLLEKYSNIKEVERRITFMKKTSLNIWRQKMESDVTNNIDTLSEALKSQIPIFEDTIEGISQRIDILHNTMSQCLDLYSKILVETKECNKDTLPTKLSTWHKFKRASEKDMQDPDSIHDQILNEVAQCLESFKLATSEKISSGQHRPEDLEEDLKSLLETLSKKINNMLSSRNSFIKLSEVYYEEATAIHSETVGMKNELHIILKREHIKRDYRMGSIPYPKLSGPHLKIALNIPVQLSFFQKFLNQIRSFLFKKRSGSMEESYTFQASVTPEQSTEQESPNQDGNSYSSIYQSDCMSTARGYSREKLPCDTSNDTEAAANVDTSISSYVLVPKEDYFGTSETGEDADSTSLEENNSISTTSSYPESKERLAYKKWTSDLDAVRDKIKTDVNKEIDDFFGDLDSNVVLKFCQLHYEVASTILKQFDCSLSSELKDCQDELEENMKKLEDHRRTLEMLKNYKKKLDDRKKTFRDVCSKASRDYRRRSSSITS